MSVGISPTIIAGMEHARCRSCCSELGLAPLVHCGLEAFVISRFLGGRLDDGDEEEEDFWCSCSSNDRE